MLIRFNSHSRVFDQLEMSNRISYLNTRRTEAYWTDKLKQNKLTLLYNEKRSLYISNKGKIGSRTISLPYERFHKHRKFQENARA